MKNKITNVCGLIVAISASILALATGGIAIPPIIVTVATVGGGLSGGIIGYFTGKPNL